MTLEDSNVSLTASNISEILNNNIKNLTSNNKTSIYDLLIENIYSISIILIILLAIGGYYYYQYKNNTIQEELDNSNNKLLKQQKINDKLKKKNIISEKLLNKQQLKMEKIIEGINNSNDLNVQPENQITDEESNNPIEEKNIEDQEEQNVEEEIYIDTDDIIKNIEFLEDTDSEELEDSNIKNLNLSVQEMENINKSLFN